MRSVLALCLGVCMLSSCSSTPEEGAPEFRASRVIERMAGMEDTPDWATGAKVMWKDGKLVYFANIMTMSGDSRPEACMKAAALDAKTQMLRYIKENITTSGQLDEASAADDPAFESITAFLSQGAISGASVKQRYYEIREQSDTAGSRVLKIRCAASIAVKEALLAKQLRDATSPKQKGNAEIRQKLLDAQKDFIDNL
ncbi:hypothetical protein [Pseudobacteriovorax antillogorgiicola]|uniref:LPP20 lipoprotein n=1 Tax=Pseudobacteriovorax antillogorgiicola TaxID=1513793 RepID=A0A1Y6BHT3_9BACT|nr:hypothetical protein [Pseudobacteriovorax antillogorgiicola]TCS55436.1 hypothetical protein EDD56_105157 [Pseudobacteriovorax antillogorgiicola]SMF12461.1 hypothetical protein SAMN06296036_105167 [Pseudobacteriovorax antillogorgiicola]